MNIFSRLRKSFLTFIILLGSVTPLIGQTSTIQEKLLLGNWKHLYNDTTINSKRTYDCEKEKDCVFWNFSADKKYAITTGEVGKWEIVNDRLRMFNKIMTTSYPPNQKGNDVSSKIERLTKSSLILSGMEGGSKIYSFFTKK